MLLVSASLDELNWQRQQEQTDAGKDLAELEYQWGELVVKNYELEVCPIVLHLSLQPHLYLFLLPSDGVCST